jgi:hypothetical protein
VDTLSAEECVRSFIVSQIESRRFPVLCPPCTAAAERTELNERPGCLVTVWPVRRHGENEKAPQCRSAFLGPLLSSSSSSSPNAHWCPWARCSRRQRQQWHDNLKKTGIVAAHVHFEYLLTTKLIPDTCAVKYKLAPLLLVGDTPA